MSWPVTTFYCSNCDFENTDIGSWRAKRYLLPNGVRLDVNWRLGWCDDCAKIVAVEDLSEDAPRLDLQEAQQKIANQPPQPVRRWWQLHWFIFTGIWRKHVDAWEVAMFQAQSMEDDAASMLGLIRDRKSAPKCLTCGSTHTHAPLITNEEPWIDTAQPKRTGFVHPLCGGDILMQMDDFRIALKPSTWHYKTEGIRLAEEQADQYLNHNSSCHHEKIICNALARGCAVPVALTSGRGMDLLKWEIPQFLKE